MLTPIFRLAKVPQTLKRRPWTRRAGGEERRWARKSRVAVGSWSRSHHCSNAEVFMRCTFLSALHFCSKHTQFLGQKQGVDAFCRHIDAITCPNQAWNLVSRCKFRDVLCATFSGRFTGQFWVRARIYVRKEWNNHSNQAQWAGDFMRQKWRIYGLSDTIIDGYWHHSNRLIPLFFIDNINPCKCASKWMIWGAFTWIIHNFEEYNK